MSAFLKDSRLDAVLICAGNEFHVLGPADENDEFLTSVFLSIMLKLNLVKMKRQPNPVCYDMNNISNEFTVEVRNRFLLFLQDTGENEPEEIAKSAKMIL